jgi:DNA mismatch endonuclease (patch repair protein)
MADHLSAKERSNMMRKVRGKDTKPEMIVRRLIHWMGFRYRLHVGNLPGHPDFIFTSKNRIIFVHGCF